MFSGESLQTFICDSYWLGGRPKLYVFLWMKTGMPRLKMNPEILFAVSEW